MSMATRTRALGSSTARKTIKLRRPRRPRLLGRFVEEETSGETVGTTTSTATTTRPLTVSRVSSAPTDGGRSSMIYEDEPIDPTLSESTNVRVRTDTKKFYETHTKRSDDDDAATDSKRVEAIWNVLEFPMQDRLDFLVKFSSPTSARHLRDVVRILEKFSRTFAMRRAVHEKMRSVQDASKMIRWETVFTPRDVSFLKSSDCYLDAVDFFGVSTFWRLAHVAQRLSLRCNKALETLRSEFDQGATFRGTDCGAILRDGAAIEASWSKRGDWRRAEIPKRVAYSTNPFLRRLGKVAE